MAEFCPECFLKLNPEYKMSYNKFMEYVKNTRDFSHGMN